MKGVFTSPFTWRHIIAKNQEMTQAQYFIGIIYKPEVDLDKLAEVLSEVFGPLENISESYPFDVTDYYFKEMGENLQKIFYSIKQLDNPSKLAKFKEKTIELENAFFTEEDKRLANLDPGYLDTIKIVLASTKHGGHKIALTDKIYADMVLDYFQGTYRAFDWTFPDFKSGRYFEYFKKLREGYLQKIKHL